ncbi:condensation domain-containing protein, partial [Francisellaceae bacterium]|nr:condensation domain-containing protein [Francisellaceae bacterium]
MQLLEQALDAIANRHQVLKSLFKSNDENQDVQVICNKPLTIMRRAYKDEEDLKLQLKEDINRVFDLRESYPIRVVSYTETDNSSLQVNESKRYLLINIHHIAFDGWSTDIFLKEINQIYHNLKTDKAAYTGLNKLSIQYKDFAIWQREYLQGEVLSEQVNYWKDKLEGVEPLALPLDYSRPSQIDYTGDNIEFSLDKGLSDSLVKFSQDRGYTLYSTLLAAFYVLLNKYTSQEDIVIGTPMANRHYAQIEDLIGFFVNSLALPQHVDSEATVNELFEQVHEQLIEAQRYQDIPFEKLVEALNIEQDQSRHPIFQVMFGVQSFGEQSEGNELFKPYALGEGYQIAKFDLSLFLSETGKGIKGSFNYAASLFKRGTIERLRDHYVGILGQIIERPNQTIKNIQVLSKEEYQTIVYDWNATDRDYPKDKTIHQLFEEQVEKTPNNIAVVYEETQLTYQELNEHSNQLARYIREQYNAQHSQELKPDTLIALCLDRSEQMIVAILAVLKAGGAYVPLDPSYPEDRISHILEDTKASLLLTQSNHTKTLNDIITQAELDTQLVDLNSINTEHVDTSNLPQHSTATDLAYVIYTSGTTGKPKGVMVEQKGYVQFILDFIRNLNTHYKIDNYDWLSLTNYVFDIFGLEYALPLLTGYKVVLSSINKVTEKALQSVNIVQQTPSVLETLITQYPTQLNSLTCLTGGEPISNQQKERFLNSYKQVINVYGPAETIIWSTKHQLLQEEPVNIGQPLSNEK